MLRQALRGATGAASIHGRRGPNMVRPAVGAGAIGYLPTPGMPARRALAAAGGRGKDGAKEDKAMGGAAAAAAKLNALTMAIKRIEHLHGKGGWIASAGDVLMCCLLHIDPTDLKSKSDNSPTDPLMHRLADAVRRQEFAVPAGGGDLHGLPRPGPCARCVLLYALVMYGLYQSLPGMLTPHTQSIRQTDNRDGRAAAWARGGDVRPRELGQDDGGAARDRRGAEAGYVHRRGPNVEH